LDPMSEKMCINYSIPAKTFIKAAEEICALFVKEDVQTFYIPYVPKTQTSPKIQPKGKLHSRYVNLKSAIKTGRTIPSTSKIEDNLQIGCYPCTIKSVI
jgi:hypothetical protein